MNYPYSYDAGTKAITLYPSDGTDGYDAIGNSEANPMTFDILKEVARDIDPLLCSEVGYYFDVKFFLSPRTSPSFLSMIFRDTEKYVVFTGATSVPGTLAFASGWIEINNGVDFQLGKATNESLKITTEGCILVYNGDTMYGMIRDLTSGVGDVRFYSCVFKCVPAYCNGIMRGKSRIWNCMFEKSQLRDTVIECDVYNTTFTGGFIVLYYNSATYNDVRITGANNACRIRSTAYSVIANNLKLYDNTSNVQMFANNFAGAIAYFTNSESDDWDKITLSGSPLINEVNIKLFYTLSLKVLDNGAPLVDADVTITDALNDMVTVTTDINGDIPLTTLNTLHWIFPPDSDPAVPASFSKLIKNPFTLTIEKAGYTDYVSVFDITTKKELIVTLVPHPPPVEGAFKGKLHKDTTEGSIGKSRIITGRLHVNKL